MKVETETVTLKKPRKGDLLLKSILKAFGERPCCVVAKVAIGYVCSYSDRIPRVLDASFVV